MLTDWEAYQIEYNNILTDIKNDKIRLKHNKKDMHEAFKTENKKKLLLIDFLFALFILFNIGAMMITNALVMKENPIIKEANPITAKTNGYQSINNVPKYFGILFHILILTILIGYYTLLKNTITDNQSYTIFLTILITIGTTLTYDFLNNTGYLIGKLILQ